MRYSLRSIEKYAPWVRRIFLVIYSKCSKCLKSELHVVWITDNQYLFGFQKSLVFRYSKCPKTKLVLKLDAFSARLSEKCPKTSLCFTSYTILTLTTFNFFDKMVNGPGLRVRILNIWDDKGFGSQASSVFRCLLYIFFIMCLKSNLFANFRHFFVMSEMQTIWFSF